VSHGRHAWDGVDPCVQGGAAQPRSIRDLFDDPTQWERVAGAASEAGIVSDGEVEVARLLAGYLDDPATGIVAALTADEQAPEAEGLRQALEPLFVPGGAIGSG
jgi:hypothetical protein